MEAIIQEEKLIIKEFSDKIPLLRNLVKREKRLQCPSDDNFLQRFLNTTDDQVDAAFQILKKYYEMRRKHASVFHDLFPSAMIPALREKVQIALPLRDKHKRQLFLFRAGYWNPSTVSVDDIFRSNYLFLEEMTSNPDTQKNGIVSIVDFEDFGFNHVRQFMYSSKHAQRMVQILQGAFPARFKEFHLINQPFVFNMLYAVIKPLLSDKIKNRIFFHGHSLDSLHKSISPSILPSSLGGEIEIKDDMDEFTQKMIDRDQHYKAMLEYGYLSTTEENMRKSSKTEDVR